MQGESIYSWVQPEAVPPPKPPRYVSKHSGKLQPTATTFGVDGTTKLRGANLGSTKSTTGSAKLPSATFGKQSQKPKADTFLRKKTGTAGTRVCRPEDRGEHSRLGESRKTTVPSRNERPIMGLQTTKNFLVANAVENILAVPKKVNNDPVRYTEKRDFGKVPAYLSQVKAQVEEERQFMEEYFEQASAIGHSEQQGQAMSEGEKNALIRQLKAKWDSVNADYQKMTMHVVLDTISKVRRKEAFESQLQELEDAIERLERAGPVIVEPDPLSQYY